MHRPPILTDTARLIERACQLLTQTGTSRPASIVDAGSSLMLGFESLRFVPTTWPTGANYSGPPDQLRWHVTCLVVLAKKPRLVIDAPNPALPQAAAVISQLTRQASRSGSGLQLHPVAKARFFEMALDTQAHAQVSIPLHHLELAVDPDIERNAWILAAAVRSALASEAFGAASTTVAKVLDAIVKGSDS